MSEPAGKHKRQYTFLLAPLERRALDFLVRRLPSWVTPDHLTVLGMIASTLIGIAYMLSNRDEHWLWLANFAIALNWFGDSLDGTLARFRKIERPRYGFYLDHLTDAYSTLLIGLGLGLSPYMLLSVGLGIVIAYLLLSINVYLETHAFAEFRFSYGRFGPTEVRLALILLNTLALLWGPLPFGIARFDATIFDLGGIVVVTIMLSLLIGRAIDNLRELAALEPRR